MKLLNWSEGWSLSNLLNLINDLWEYMKDRNKWFPESSGKSLPVISPSEALRLHETNAGPAAQSSSQVVNHSTLLRGKSDPLDISVMNFKCKEVNSLTNTF